MGIKCKGCNSLKIVKNGCVIGKQRYRCKECGMNFIEGDKRIKYKLQDKLKFLKLYLENCGIRTIERLTGIRNRQVSLWIEEAAEDIKRELIKQSNNVSSIKDVAIMEIDELYTYIKKDRRMVGKQSLYGLLLIENQGKLLILK